MNWDWDKLRDKQEQYEKRRRSEGGYAKHAKTAEHG